MSEPNAKSKPVLSFRALRMAPDLKNSGAAGLDLNLRPGELALFCFDTQSKPPEIANLAMGMIQPSQGEVRFLGQNWADLENPEVLAARSEIGRVFAPRSGACWVQNLDVDENVMVAQFFRPGLTAADVLRRTEDLVRRFEIDRLPQGRPSATSVEELTRAQWVRAFLPQPLKLLILERPGFRLTPTQMEPFFKQVKKVRADGTAVLWIDFQGEFMDRPDFDATCRYDELPEARSGAS